MRKMIALLTAVMVFLSQGAGWADSQVDALINKLVQKGVLSQEDAVQLKAEVVAESKVSESKVQAASEAKNEEMPAWVKNTKLTGDFRTRYQYDRRNTEDASERDRSRGRIRYRLGIETKVNDQVKVAAGLASDGGSPRSTNQTLGNTGASTSFGKGNVILNYAYGEYKPNEQVTLTAGQMKNPIWEPMEFLWDADITPTGGALQYNNKLSDTFGIFGLGSGFVINETAANEADPFMYVLQAGLWGKVLEGKADYKLAGMFNGLDNVTKTTLSNRSSPATNSTNASSQYSYKYSASVGAMELGWNNPLGKEIAIPRLGVFGQYAQNPDPNSQNVAWMSGAYLGNAKVQDKGQWKAIWAYKLIGQDAWLDILPDSDFYSGATDVKGHKAALEYGLSKNVNLGLAYYHTQRIKAAKAQETLVQTDINFKF